MKRIAQWWDATCLKLAAAFEAVGLDLPLWLCWRLHQTSICGPYDCGWWHCRACDGGCWRME